MFLQQTFSRVHFLLLFVTFLLLSFQISEVVCQSQKDDNTSEVIDRNGRDSFTGEKCNDAILYEIMMKAAKNADNRTALRQNMIDQMQLVFPNARSMGAICTSRKFIFPEFVNHRYCTVRIGSFKCHTIVF